MITVEDLEKRQRFDILSESNDVVRELGVADGQGGKGWPTGIARLTGLAALAELDRDVREFGKITVRPRRMRTKSALVAYQVVLTSLLGMSNGAQLANAGYSYDPTMRSIYGNSRRESNTRLGGELSHSVLLPRVNGGLVEARVEMISEPLNGEISFEFSAWIDQTENSGTGIYDVSAMIVFLANLCAVVWSAHQGVVLTNLPCTKQLLSEQGADSFALCY